MSIHIKEQLSKYKTPLMRTDEELLVLAKEGNDLAFQQLVHRHEPLVRSIVRGMLGQVMEADDVAQEVFIRLYKSLDKFRGDSTLGTYLTRIAINLSLNELKKRKRDTARYAMSTNQELQELNLEDKNANPKNLETKELVDKALQFLDPDFRAVVVLRLVDGYSVKETAEILKLPQGTIASRLARAQKKLRVLLNQLLRV